MKRKRILFIVVLLISAMPMAHWLISRGKTRFIDRTCVLYSQRSGYEYLLHLPKGYSKANPPPMIIYLHGSGELNKSVRHLIHCNLPQFVKGTKAEENFPFVVVSPFCFEQGWNPDRLRDFVLELTDGNAAYPVDATRVYLTGFSMGGFGVWRAAAVSPDLFAAMAPVAGGGRKEDAGKLKNMPIWCFHGEFDEAVPYERSVNMVEAVRQTGNEEVEFTTIPGANHGIMADVYSNPNLYQWFLSHKTIKQNN